MTNEVANETLQAIGLSIGRDKGLYDDWEMVEAIFKVREGSLGHSAAQFVADGERIGFLLDSSGDAFKLMPRLQAATINNDGTSWAACKIDIVRAIQDFKIKFEYHDEKRWDEPLPF